ncbi:MAG: L-serine ammonia-lyase, iron-sulfur-dependent, subunit alpha [Bacteroidales bacterium]|jgi:L-serine dehydratase|nr:L-serine ammonia-lyase, iron-sulfur-dependent, subunit alpha [Bacteroidales bacterium]
MQSIKEIYKIGYGPSSSHTIGPYKAAKHFLNKNPNAHSFTASLYGSLAATGRGHHTDKAIITAFENKEVKIIWKDDKELKLHPNGLIFKAIDVNNKTLDTWEVYSIGGGDLQDNTGILNNNKIYDQTKLTDILDFCNLRGKTFWEYVEDKEGMEIWEYLKNIWEIMKETIHNGIENEGVLPGEIHLPRKASTYNIKAMNSHGTIKNQGLLFSYALAVSEENAAGGKIITSPTCGSSGVLPGVLYYLYKEEGVSEKKILKALATAGLIANLVKKNASISGAEVGCQGEIGTACAMAAAAATQINGGSLRQIEYAAEMGFEHNLGLTCDPVGGYVQIPCIERNAIAAGKAQECSVYSLFTDGGHKISFDDAVEIMAETGKDLQSAYRETGIGGLAKKWRPFNV